MKKTLIGLLAVGLLGSCTQTQGWFGSDDETDSTGQKISSETAHNARLVRDITITKENAYSDLFLDSAVLEAYLQNKKISPENADRMRAFYLVRNNQYAWFTSEGPTEQARGLWSLYGSEPGEKKDEPGYAIKGRMDSLLTNDSLLLQRIDTALKKDPSQTALAEATAANDSLLLHTELALTAQLVQLAREDNGVVTEENFYWLVPRKKLDALALADSLLRETGSPMAAAGPQYAALKAGLKHYYNAAKAGGWQAMPLARGLGKGIKSPAVSLLKKRLALTGDYPAADTSNVFTDSLTTAIQSVQEQYGFAPTGVITDSLVAELNVSATERLQQILVNINRALWMKPLADSAHVSVNIPSLELLAYGDSGRTLKMPVIVGKEGTGTTAFSGEISTVVFSPYWNLPQSIVQTEIKPAMDKDPNYLKKRNMEIVKQDNGLPVIRQRPGADNALGRVKFLFPNSFDIYLHDTPHKDLFAQQVRALSHGCIRVAKPDSLAAFVLRGQSDWTPEKIAAAMNSGKEQEVAVKKAVPVVISYYTAFADVKGRIHFRKDVYGYDKKTASKMFTNTAIPAGTSA